MKNFPESEIIRGASPVTNERGQSSVLIAMTMVVFIAFLAFLANIGQVIHDKILVQAIADAAALSAANMQAIGMNEIADLNAEIKKLDDELVEDIEDAPTILNDFAMGMGWATYRYYTKQARYAMGLQDKANKEFAEMATAAANKVIEDHNEKYRRIHPSTAENTRDGLLALEPWTMEEVMGDRTPRERLGELKEPRKKTVNFRELYCFSKTCKPAKAGYFGFSRDSEYNFFFVYNIKVPYWPWRYRERKWSSSEKTYYRVRVKRERVRALIDMDHYGFSVHLPEIVAYSAAQPHKGDTFKRTPDYEARLVPLWQTYPNETSDKEYMSFVDEFRH